jgi:hypothetical protein
MYNVSYLQGLRASSAIAGISKENTHSPINMKEQITDLCDELPVDAWIMYFIASLACHPQVFHH